MHNDLLSEWSPQDSANLYGIKEWGGGYFDINNSGEVILRVSTDGKSNEIRFLDIIKNLVDRGIQMPALVRVENLLEGQITLLNESFHAAMKEFNYTGKYQGLFPIKVNQQQQVIEKITKCGARYNHSFEAGSKAELIVALHMLYSTENVIVCNGYKDADFFDLGLYAHKMGYRCFFVIETPSELPILIERSKKLGIQPLIGLRIKLSSKAGGHWQDSGGDNSLFGLTTSEIVDIIDLLRAENILDSLQLLHYHLGSQIPNIRDIRNAIQEAARFYVGLIQEGAPMGFLDLGGGLAIDYDGSQTNFVHSKNYTLQEYCTDIIESLTYILNDSHTPHPCIMTESGRATVAYSTILVCNVLDVTPVKHPQPPEKLPEAVDDTIFHLWEIHGYMDMKNIQECYHDAVHHRNELRERFKSGGISLRDRALGENIFLSLINQIIINLKKVKRIPRELRNLGEALYDIYYCNFSVFQSLPDAWAIDQIFPVIPLHRHTTKPDRQGILGDITCDSDGKIDHFPDLHDIKRTLPLHSLKDNEEYYLGIFLVGAYQETLGDLHNLFGDPNVVSIRVENDGTYDIVREIHGDSIADVLSYVEYEPDHVWEQFRRKTETAIKKGKITVSEGKIIMQTFNSSMNGYTYFKR
ncbi:MAG: biosynthetic arginine decarboxylase [Salinispira sp.]